MRKNIDKKVKYITGGVAAVAMSVAACAAGVDARNTQDVNAGGRYDAGAVLNETEATDTDAETAAADSISEEELVDKLTSAVDVSEKDIYKDETVYAFADASGKTTEILVNEVLKNTDNAATLADKTDLTDIENVKGDETFTVDGDTITWEANGNDITYQGKSTKELPVNVAVSYYLDGNKVTPEEIAGKSGKVKIRFDYTNNATVVKDINGRDEDINVPFVAVTGMALGDNFTNVTVTNGRCVAQGDSNIVIGFGMPGLLDSLKASNEDFAEDVDIPDYFEVEADVTDFSLDMTATVVVDGSAMNISGELDTSSLDELMTSLSDATSQLVDGTGELSDGVATLLEKMGEFDTGMGTLKAGIDTLATSSVSLVDGIGTIDASAQSISSAISTLDAALNTPMTDTAKASVYNTAYSTASSAAKTAAETEVGAQMAEGTDQYNAIKAQASAQFASQLTNSDAQALAASQASAAVAPGTDMLNSIISQVSAAIQPQVKEALATSFKSGVAAGAMAANPELTQEQAANIAAAAASQADSQLESNASAAAQTIASLVSQNVAPSVASATAVGVMNSIASNYSDAMGTSVADACQQAAVTAAGQAAGEAAGTAAGTAAVQGAEAAKSQIAAQIEAVQSNGYSLVTGAQALAAGTSTMDDAAPALTEGIAALKEGAAALADGSTQLLDGISTLNDGALTLKDGMQTYDTEAISKIVNSYNGDIKSLVERLSAIASASAEYDTFTMHEDGVGATTKFIIKTAGIEAAE